MARTDTLGHFLTDVADSIRAKSGTSDTIQASQFDTAISNIPSGGVTLEDKDVNFYDYDGTLVNSYTKNEFLALSSMPNNPEHEGLTAQGWNWSLTDAQEYVTTYGGLDIGQMYITTDGKTHIYIDLSVIGRKQIYVGFGLNGTATIDWGDNSTSTTVTGTNVNSYKNTDHTYSTIDKYTIKIEVPDGSTLKIFRGSNRCIINDNVGSSNESYHREIRNIIKNINFGNNINIGDYSFEYCQGLETITIPSYINTWGTSAFDYSGNIKCFIFPKDSTITFSSYAFRNSGIEHILLSKNTDAMYNPFSNCSKLKRLYITKCSGFSNSYLSGCTNMEKIIIPNTITSITATSFASNCPNLKYMNIENLTALGNSFFSSDYSLQKLKFSSNISSIGTSCFSACYGIILFDFRDSIQVPTLSATSAFTNIWSDSYTLKDARIVVPDALYDTWKAAENWSTYAGYIVKASEYTEA